MKVRAKFKVEKLIRSVTGHEVVLSPVTCGSTENEQFFHWTPYGRIEMGTLNDEAAAQFVPGLEFYVDFLAA